MAPMARREPGEWRRRISGLLPLWAWGILITVVGVLSSDGLAWAWASAGFLVAVLFFVRPPRQDDRDPVEVSCPVRGRWTVVHSPASSVPSHGVRAYGQSHAIDLIHPRPRGTTRGYPVGGGFEKPERFSSFGESIHAVADGTVVGVVHARRDHLSRTSWLAFAYMMVIDGLRDLGGPSSVVGNHVVVQHEADVFSLYAHLRRGSATVSVGDAVRAGQVIGEVGNSGNTSEPHLHFQLMDRARPLRAAGLPMVMTGISQQGEIDDSWISKAPQREVEDGMPANFQVFDAP